MMQASGDVVTKNPIVFDKDHPVTQLIVKDCHDRVMHSGVKSTLTKYWIVHGRQLIKKLIRKCVICRRYGGKSYKLPPPPLPSSRVTESPPFSYTAIDFAGPLYVKNALRSSTQKVWLCLFTCCVIWAVHLDLVTTQSFLHCYRRLTLRRGFLTQILSDNGSTFKAADKAISSVLSFDCLACVESPRNPS